MHLQNAAGPSFSRLCSRWCCYFFNVENNISESSCVIIWDGSLRLLLGLSWHMCTGALWDWLGLSITRQPSGWRGFLCLEAS